MKTNGGPPVERPSTTSTETPVSDAFRRVLDDLSEIEAYVSHLVSSRIDRFKLSVRHALFGVCLGIVALIAVGGLIVTGIVLLMSGLSGALAALFDTSLWVGNLVAGALAIALISVGVPLGYRQFANAGKSRTVRKYEQRQSEQRHRFGHDVAERAAEQFRQ